MKRLLVLLCLFAISASAMDRPGDGVVILFENGDPITNATYIEEADEYILSPSSYIQLDLEGIHLVEYSYSSLDTTNWIWADMQGSMPAKTLPDGRLFFTTEDTRIRQVTVVGDTKVAGEVQSVGELKSNY